MDMTTERTWYHQDGIFSNAYRDDTREHVLSTLEHAYPSGDPAYTWLPKVLPGRYRCVRGKHALHDGKEFETFEVTGVPGHSGILFHHGNWNQDSEGCILTGDAVTDGVRDGSPQELVTNTNPAFERFMDLQEGSDSFMLTVKA